MDGYIALEATLFQPGEIHQHQPVDTVIEVGVTAEVNELDPAGLTEFGILFIQRGDTGAQVA